jgi:hypothetical protein
LASENEWIINSTISAKLLIPEFDKQVIADIATGVKSIMTIDFILNYLMSKSLRGLWGPLNILQLILDIPQLGIVLPYNAFELTSALKEIVTLNIFDSDWLTEHIFKDAFTQTTPYNDRFELNG